MTLVAISLAACKGDDFIKPVSEKIQGPLGEYFEVVTKGYKIRDGKISIELKRIKEGFPSPWKEGMELGNLNGYEPLFSIEFLDADGNTISKDRTDVVWDKEELNILVLLRVDETASITFDANDEIAQFKMTSTFKVFGTDNDKSELADGFYCYMGKWESNQYAAQPCKVEFTKIDTTLNNCSYTNMKFKVRIPLQGEIKGDELHFVGKNNKDLLVINLKVGSNGYYLTGKGVDYAHNEDTAILNLKRGDPNDDSAFIDDDDTYDESGLTADISTGGSAEWDEVLDSYEEYVNKYIMYIKKAAKGDMTALAEYPSLMEKAKELGERLDNAKDQMSASQLTRYNKITMKMVEAAKEMSN